MKYFVLFILVFLNLIAFGQVDDQRIPFSDWNGKSLPVQDWVSVNGDTIAKNYLKNKVCFFNFFSAGCPPCMQEVGYLNRLKREFSEKDDVVIIGIYCGKKEDYKRYIESAKQVTKAGSSSSLKLNYSTVPTPRYTVVAIDPSVFRYTYNAWGTPSNLILDKNGVVRFCSNGFPMEKAVQESLFSEYVAQIDKLRIN